MHVVWLVPELCLHDYRHDSGWSCSGIWEKCTVVSDRSLVTRSDLWPPPITKASCSHIRFSHIPNLWNLCKFPFLRYCIYNVGRCHKHRHTYTWLLIEQVTEWALPWGTGVSGQWIGHVCPYWGRACETPQKIGSSHLRKCAVCGQLSGFRKWACQPTLHRNLDLTKFMTTIKQSAYSTSLKNGGH